MELLKKYFAREFFLTLVILALVSYLPKYYKQEQVSDTVCMTVLIILVAIGATYGIINVRKAKLAIEEVTQDVTGSGPIA